MSRKKEAAEKKTGVAAWNESMGKTSVAESSGERRNHAGADRRRRIGFLVVLLLACIAWVVCLWPANEQITRGLWLKDGTEVTIQVAKEDGSEATAQDVDAAVATINARLGKSGISEYSVHRTSDTTLAIDLTNESSAKEIAEIVGGAGVIQFVRADEIGDADALQKINAGTKNVLMADGTYKEFMDNSSVESAKSINPGAGSYAVSIKFTEDGKQKFAEVTKELAEETGRIAIVIDGHVASAPSVSQEISGGEVYISGDYSADEANALAIVLSGSPMALKLSVGEVKEVEALVGKTTLWVMVGVAVAAFVVVSAVAFKRYHKLGLLVAGGMAVYAIFILGMMALASRVHMFVLTIPGVIGVVCAAAATLVSLWFICDGFKNRVAEGKSVRGATTSVPSNALRPMLGPCGVATVASLVFLFMPQPYLREFGLTFVLGMVSGVAAVFWYAVTLLRLIGVETVQKNPEAWGVKATPATTAATTEAEAQ